MLEILDDEVIIYKDEELHCVVKRILAGDTIGYLFDLYPDSEFRVEEKDEQLCIIL